MRDLAYPFTVRFEMRRSMRKGVRDIDWAMPIAAEN